MSLSDCQNLLDQDVLELGFSHWGMQKLERPVSFEHYQAWLDKDYHGEMKYLEAHAQLKEYPTQLRKNAKSSFVFAFPYVNSIPGRDSFPLKKARVALYAQGFDYHFSLKEKLKQIIKKLQTNYPQEDFLPITDSFPVMERDLASRAGLGWFGKNTCLIHPKKGSLFLLCEIITSLDLKNTTEPLPDFCGTCTKCMEICPTQALESPRVLNATKCISYWTIESRKIPPVNLREKFGDWLFGCDLCQTVCPWNQKIYKNLLQTENFVPHKLEDDAQLENELIFLLTASGKKISQWSKGTPLSRAGSFGLRRNALIVVANKKIKSLKVYVENLTQDEKLSELALWTLSRLG
ncbi:MAG: tRNA epoxyqueuosine(34) reductase QueG [Bdellovibrionota bacterium]